MSQVVMDAPPETENVIPFIEINKILGANNVHVPEIFAQNIEQGFLLLEDLGDTDYLSSLGFENSNSLYEAAIHVLKSMQALNECDLPKYTRDLLQIEMSLFDNWFLKKHMNLELDKKQSQNLNIVRESLVKSSLEQPTVFVHRDYHSRNLMVTDENNPGVIDFQDAVIGPITYDLVSLLKDCYIKWSDQEIHTWVDYYRSIQPLVSDIPREQFIKWFDLMGIQRHLKAIGIFARLNHRDNKPGYLKDIPRTLSYIVDCAPRYEETQPLMQLIDELDLVNRVLQ